MKRKRTPTLIPIIALLILSVSFVVGGPLNADDDTPNPSGSIVIEGPVSAININIITIANIVIELEEDDPILAAIQIGDTIYVEGDVENQEGGLVVHAQIAEPSDSNLVVPVIQITGPVEAININIVTIYNIDIQLDPDDPILTTLVIGDILNVDGSLITAGDMLVIVAINVIVIEMPDPEATPEATPEVTPDVDDGDDADLPITIVIEGPVEAININIVTIFDIDIEVDPDDPILNVIEIGDTIRVEGDTTGTGDTIIIVAINITIINVEIFSNDQGEVWRDSGNCSNGPPPWAPAHGWRRRCEGNNNSNNGGGRGSGKKRT